MISEYSLSLLVFIPIIASLLLLFIPERYQQGFKWITLCAGVAQLIIFIPMLLNFNPDVSQADAISGFQFVEFKKWITIDLGSFGLLSAKYFLGIDGINIWLVGLSIVVLLVSVLSSWKVSDRSKGYFALFLLLNGAIIGCFVALDFLLFYLFFEFMLLPMFFLIGLWGGPRRDYASIKFFLYTLVGSLLILIVMIVLYTSVIDPLETARITGMDMNSAQTIANVQLALEQGKIAPEKLVHTFNMVYMADPANFIPGSLLDASNIHELFGLPLRAWAFLFVFAGFAIKIPLVPLHTWLPDAHVEAPTAISVILAGVLLKVGAYGLIRGGFLIFPDGMITFAWLIGLIGVISIIYGAMNALASRDLKRLVAYSSVSHMGFVALGLASATSEGIGGAIFQLVSHGVISAGLFILVGVLYDRYHDRNIVNYSGLATKMPGFTVLSVLFFFASLGLPGMSGFIAEILILLGAFSSGMVNGLLNEWLAITAVAGMILGAAYYLWTLQRMYFGEFFIRNQKSKLLPLTKREMLMLVPLAIITIVLGIFPSLILDQINPSVTNVIEVILKNGNHLLGFLPE